MDERFPLFGNDVRLARRLAGNGAQLWITPEAIAVHAAHSSTRRLGAAVRKQQSLAATIRLLSESEHPAKVWLFRALMLAENTALALARRPQALGGSQLLAALRGSPDPLPREPAAEAIG